MKRVKQQTGLDSNTFTRGVSDAIRALRAVYSGVRTMLDELTAELEEPPNKIFRLPVAVKSLTTKERPDEKVLRSWFGAFYTSKAAQKDPAGKKAVKLTVGQDLIFVKVVLLHEDSSKQYEPPHLLYGKLSKCRVNAISSAGKTLTVDNAQFRKILEDIQKGTTRGIFETRAFARPTSGSTPVKGSGSKKAKVERKLLFTLHSPPKLCMLFEIQGRESIRKIANELKGKGRGRKLNR